MFDVPLHSKDKVQQRANGLRRIALIIHKTRIQLRYELVTILHPLRFKVKKAGVTLPVLQVWKLLKFCKKENNRFGRYYSFII
jgi:hypothetical protein